MTIAGKNII
ncbi:hypothetical protein YPPY91_4013, partial [Yersinia pestis PY-91]